MTESELDDAWRVALQSRTRLNEVKERFRSIADAEQNIDLDNASINEGELVSPSMFFDELGSVIT